MKKYFSYLTALLIFASAITFTGCNKDEEEDVVVDPGESTTELLVKKFDAAPADANDAVWATTQTLTGNTEVPDLAARGTYLNSDGEGTEENLGLFDPYTGEKNNFTMNAGYTSDMMYMLIKWEDNDDSQDRQSWYFDATDKLWKGEHKYANAADDKFYEDKFAFLFPVGDVAGFEASTCYATCHSGLDIANAKDKHTRHFLKNSGEVVDMWHWKRVRGTFAGQVDDQQMTYVAAPYNSSSNGRGGDETGAGGYANNSQTLNNGTADVSVPLYVIPGKTDYHWISETDINDGTAKMITAVDAEGVLTYVGGTIDPSTGGFEQGTGAKRMPSVTTKAFTEGRADINITAEYTGTGWVCLVSRKLNTGDADDVVFAADKVIPFGFAIFDNAAIAHGVKPNLTMTFEQ